MDVSLSQGNNEGNKNGQLRYFFPNKIDKKKVKEKRWNQFEGARPVKDSQRGQYKVQGSEVNASQKQRQLYSIKSY